MASVKRKSKTNRKLPLLVEKGQDGWYVAECPVFDGCYTQGRTIDDAIANIKEVIALILEEKDARSILKSYNPQEISLHTITI
ncbi:MAG: type II toxin-antitoxin system HicB family antitoxin [Bacteroidetes bacterium]|nr:type II toxin-antitoxin system HicB family antitoxin [Bacteroidota bacterium]